jgi:hypothetical protein
VTRSAISSTVRIGPGAGWSRDRLDAALDLVIGGDLDCFCSDSMSETTMDLAQVRFVENPRPPPTAPAS